MLAELQLVDWWSIGHVFIFGLLPAWRVREPCPLLKVVLIATGYELFENSETLPFPWGDPNFLNTVVDILIAWGAAGVARAAWAKWGHRVPPKVVEAVND